MRIICKRESARIISNLMLIAVAALLLSGLYWVDQRAADQFSDQGYCDGNVKTVTDLPSLHAVCEDNSLERVKQ
jgi:hypothetical protein